MKPSLEISLGRIAGVRTSIHLSLLVMFPLGWIATRSVDGAVATLIGFAILMLVHELGHALMARRQGLAVYEIRLYFMHGVCEYASTYSKRKQALVAWGGVLAQMALLIVAATIAKLSWALGIGLPELLAPAFFVWVPINLLVAIFNLLPTPPLDGSVAWRGLADIFARPTIDQPATETKPRRSSATVVSLEQQRAARRDGDGSG